MEKIAQALAKMNERRDLISPVIRKGSEYYFLFNKKHKWSISYGTHATASKLYSLYFYTMPNNIEEIAIMPSFTEDMYVHYSQGKLLELGCLNAVINLYEFLESSSSGIEKALDDILSV